jgi:hypothetical protein
MGGGAANCATVRAVGANKFRKASSVPAEPHSPFQTSRVARMAIVYTTTDQLAIAHGVKGCIYGNAGTGKTLLCATAPRPLMIQAENGTLSLTRANIERVFGVGTPGVTYSIPVAQIKTVEDFEKVYNDLFQPQIWHSFDSLYIDSFSEIVEAILKHELATNKDGRMAYGEMAERAIEWLKKFRDLPGKNVFATCEQGLSSDTGLMGPSMPGKMLDRKIPYLFDEVLQICIGEDPTTKQPFRFLRTQSDLKNYAKDRSGALDPRGEYPSLTNIISKISAAS